VWCRLLMTATIGNFDWDVVAKILGTLAAFGSVVAVGLTIYQNRRRELSAVEFAAKSVQATVYRPVEITPLPPLLRRLWDLLFYLVIAVAGLLMVLVGLVGAVSLGDARRQWIGIGVAIGGIVPLMVYGLATLNTFGATSGRPRLRTAKILVQGADDDVLVSCRAAVRGATSRVRVLDTAQYPTSALIVGIKDGVNLLGGPLVVGVQLEQTKPGTYRVHVVADALNQNTRVDWGRARLAIDRVCNAFLV
jgi:hypothetical protein